jgi:hypothetical protein
MTTIPSPTTTANYRHAAPYPIYEGCRVATAADGEEALIKAQSERPDSSSPIG